MESEIATKEHDQLLVRLGFYPAEISDHSIVIKDNVHNRKIRFGLNDRDFRSFSSGDEDVPDELRNVIEKKNEWFDEFRLYRPKYIPKDPFLFGLKNGKCYFICAWGLNAWIRL